MSKMSNSNFIKRVKDVDSCNILGVGPFCGKWQTSCLKWLVQKYAKNQDQRPYILKTKQFPNFCTVFDLDFRFKEYTEVSHSDLIGFAKKLREFTKDITGKDVRILITRKQELCYEKKLKKEGMIYASGAHMYFLKHRFTKSEAVKIAFKFEPLLKGLNFLEPVIDDKVFPIGENGVFMIGSAKPDTDLFHVPLCIVGEDVDKCTVVNRDTVVELYLEEIYADDCYISKNSVFVPEKQKPIKKSKQKYVYSGASNDLQRLVEEWNFNLEYLFELIKFFKDDVSNEDTWKTLVFFLKETNIPTSILGKSLNNFYQPSNEKENFNLLANRQIRNNSKVYKVKRAWLNKFFKDREVEFDYEKLFFPQKFNFICDVYGGCDKSIIWPSLNAFQNKIKSVFSEIQDFSRKPMIHYKYKSTIGIKKTKQLQFRTCNSTKDFADKYVYFIQKNEEGEEIKQMKLRKIVSEMQMEEEFHVYNQIRTYPFYGQNPLNPCILNIWKQPDLFFYKAFRVVDWTKHAIFEHLKRVMCNNDPWKFNYLQTYIAMKIQQPGRRIEKTLNITNNTTGCGKTTFFHLMTALLGEDKTFELTDVKQLAEKFNAHLHMVLLVLIDDIDKLSKKQQDMLKVITTQKNFKVERKGVDSTKEKCFFDTITTSNNPDDLWICKEDRRNELVSVSDCRKQNTANKPFWDQFYKGLEDLDLMKAIFDHFANFKIKVDVRNKTCRFDQGLLDKRICNSLPTWVDFLKQLFEKPTQSDMLANWNLETNVFTRGYLWISPSYLYKLFGFYISEIGSRIRPNYKTFIANLDRIGLTVARRRCKELFSNQFRSIELSPKLIQNALFTDFGNQEVFESKFEDYIRWFEDPFTPDQRRQRHPVLGLVRTFLQQPDSEDEDEPS